jgi:siroheme synthase-like protein
MDKQYFPTLLQMDLFPALVVGGGNVAYRKVQNLLQFGAKLKVIAPEFCANLEHLISSSKIDAVKKHYSSSDIIGFRLVFSCTGNIETDKLVYNDAIKTGALINVADLPELCNFIMPAIIKKNDFVLAISSQAKAPFYSKFMKEQIEKTLPHHISDIITLAGEFRQMVINSVQLDSPAKKNAAFARFLEIDWEHIIADKGKPEAYLIMQNLINS